jgi:hypothetical protein
MEATADTLLNQVADLFLSKIDKQNIDPKFLKKFTEQLLGKFSYTSSEPIKQKPASPNDGTGGSLVKDLKKVYNDLVKETTYKENYKKFLKYVLPDELLKQSTDNIVTPAEKPEIKTVEKPEIKSVEKPEIKTVEKPEIKTEIKSVEKPEIKTEIKSVEKPEIKSVVSDFKSAMSEIKSVIFKNYSDIADEKLSPAIKMLLNKDISALPKIETAEKPEIKSVPQMNEGRADLIKDAPTEQKVILTGITESAARLLKGKFSDIFKGFFDKLKFNFESPKGGLGLLGGGIALLLGGLAALVAGLMTDGPFKGLLKILSKVGIIGGIKMLEGAAKIFISSLKQLINAPIKLLDDAAKLIGKIFGKEAFKAVLTPIRAMKGLFTKTLEGIVKTFTNTLKNFIDAPIKLLNTVGTGLKGILSSLLPKSVGNIAKGAAGIFTKMLGGLVKFLKPILGKIPGIGTIISWGFAYSRFKSGDVIGGFIDVLSGIASIFPGVGTAIAIGLDVLNAFLDAKAGGANKKTTQKKTGLLKEWVFGLGKMLYEGVKYIPIIGPYMQAVEDMQAGKWLEASYNLVRAIPGLGILVDLLNWFTGGETEQGIKEGLSNAGSMIGDWLGWLKDNIWEKITGFVTGVFDTVKEWWNNLSWDPGTWLGGEGWFGGKEEPTKQSKKTAPDSTKTADQTNQTEALTPMADGGIVTEPTKALVGEAGPEAVLPLNKYFDPQSLSLNNTTLEQIAGNTKDTNKALNALADAIIRMAGAFNQKASVQGSTTVINAGGGSKDPTSASMAANFNLDPIRRVRSQFAV